MLVLVSQIQHHESLSRDMEYMNPYEVMEPPACGRVRDALAFLGLDHGVGHFRPLSITRHRHLLTYHGTAMSHEGLCQVF